jgi:uncharacterized tellurite resistance protein B-like protein
MIEHIKALLSGSGGRHPADATRARFADMQVAAAALLVEAAQMDANFDAAERTKILDLVRTRFELTEAEAQNLVELAAERVADSSQLYSFTRVVKDSFDQEARVALMEMLWEVVYADGALHDLEANLMRRIAGLIYVSDRDSGAARKRALNRLGLDR